VLVSVPEEVVLDDDLASVIPLRSGTRARRARKRATESCE
jgi:hypothetical protein